MPKRKCRETEWKTVTLVLTFLIAVADSQPIFLLDWPLCRPGNNGDNNGDVNESFLTAHNGRSMMAQQDDRRLQMWRVSFTSPMARSVFVPLK